MTTATDMLAAYLAAEIAVLSGKEHRMGERTLRLEDLDMIRAGRKEWEQKVSAERAKKARVPTVGGLTFSRATFGGRH